MVAANLNYKESDLTTIHRLRSICCTKFRKIQWQKYPEKLKVYIDNDNHGCTEV